jgi:hypothetical protein
MNDLVGCFVDIPIAVGREQWADVTLKLLVLKFKYQITFKHRARNVRILLRHVCTKGIYDALRTGIRSVQSDSEIKQIAPLL